MTDTENPSEPLRANFEYNSAVFAFVQTLAEDMSSGDFDLPSWPAVVIQIRRALEDEESSIQDVVRLIGSDPVLAARVLKTANSAFIGRSNQVSDLRSAVNRLGFDMVRNLSISLAISQIFHSKISEQIKLQLAELWVQSTSLAAFCYVLAKQSRRVNPDEAFLAGLIHDIGKLYVLMRAQGNSELFDSGDSLEEIMDEWNSNIGRAIVESWGFPDELVDSINDEERADQEKRGLPKLFDVVTVAKLLVRRQIGGTKVAAVDLDALPSSLRLNLDADVCNSIMFESEEEIQALRQALSM